MPIDWKYVRAVAVKLLDPARDKRGLMTIEPSGDLKFNAERLLSSREGLAERARIGKMQENLRKRKVG